ncbi:MAG: hypothetical protein CMN86_13365 [Stappia sp.]|jgi:hypothetical protein|nr:hypothetical protein [Stappia sp.]|tara:strand:+ start:220 stop:639 length:420 start_codon:yes stop_codon:yes gene_type:complete
MAAGKEFRWASRVAVVYPYKSSGSSWPRGSHDIGITFRWCSTEERRYRVRNSSPPSASYLETRVQGGRLKARTPRLQALGVHERKFARAQRKQLLFAREERLEQGEATLDLVLVLCRDVLSGNFGKALQPRAEVPPVIL